MTTTPSATPHRWDSRRAAKAERLHAGSARSTGKVVDPGQLKDLLQDVIRPGDRVALEGDNQKQADFLSRTLADCDPQRINDLHMLISSVSRPEHLDLFERGIATKLDLAYAGPQSVRIAQLVEDGTVHIGAIHTYVELYARMFVDLAPDVVLLCAAKADRDGNLYTGPNTEDTPTIAEAAAFRDGVVIVQADEIVGRDDLPRVDIPGDWVDFVVSGRPAVRSRTAVHPRPASHRARGDPQGDDRDPRRLRAPPGDLAQPRHRVRHCRNRIDPADVRRDAGPQGQDRQALDAEPASHADPGDRVRLGRVDPQLRRRSRAWSATPPPGPTSSSPARTARCGPTGCCASWPASTRSTCSSAPRCRSTRDANSSTVTDGRLSGFGGAPNMGHDPHGRRHAVARLAGPRCTATAPSRRGRKLVVQIAQTFRAGGIPTFVETLDAVDVGKAGRHAVAAGDDLRRRRHPRRHRGGRRLPVQGALAGRPACRAGRDRRASPRSGGTADARQTERLRRDGLVAFPEDLRSRPGWPTAPCWPPAASPTWSPGRADCTTRPRSSGLVSADAEPQTRSAATRSASCAPSPIWRWPRCGAEAELTPKPGLVDRRGTGAHTDMNLAMLHASADVAACAFAECASAARQSAPGHELRARVGRDRPRRRASTCSPSPAASTPTAARCGRSGCSAAGARPAIGSDRRHRRRGRLAMHPDPGYGHGRLARRTGASALRCSGATGEAQAGFPHVACTPCRRCGAPAARGADERSARLDALLAADGQSRRHLRAAPRRPGRAYGGADAARGPCWPPAACAHRRGPAASPPSTTCA